MKSSKISTVELSKMLTITMIRHHYSFNNVVTCVGCDFVKVDFTLDVWNQEESVSQGRADKLGYVNCKVENLLLPPKVYVL